MFDDEAEGLTDRAFGDFNRRRDAELYRQLNAKRAEATHAGALGGSRYNQVIAGIYRDELRTRTDELWRLVKELSGGSDGAFDGAVVTRIKAYLEDRVGREASDLTERLRKDIELVRGSVSPLATITDEKPRIVDGLFAHVDMFVRQRRHQANAPTVASVNNKLPNPRSVFVVHGRDDLIRDDIFAFLRALGLEPIEWTEAVRMTGKGSPYIGEVLDSAFARAQAVLVLLTPDDEVRLSPTLQRSGDGAAERELRLQPRPNVLFEAGMAFGHQPDRTILVEIGDTKPFSDVAGRHSIRLSNAPAMRRALADRLVTAGCAVDVSGGAWRAVGNFEVTRRSAIGEKGSEAKPTQTMKYVDLNYPADSGFQNRLAADGFSVQWCLDRDLARKLDIEGWSLATMTDANGNEVVFKVRDHPSDHTLVKKRAV
jgi:predicted nucleotide-binding protein